MFLILATAAVLLLSSVSAENMIQVFVGREGSFYTPQTVTAAVNDTVQFVFAGEHHGVVQASFDKPCVPLPGGFSSGLQGTGSDFSGPTVLWNLTITNVSEPIWFYCPASRPDFHCAEGMVGAINPTSQEMYNQFKIAAQATRGNATVNPPQSNQGQGASATASPSANPAPTSSSGSSTSDSTSSLSPTASQMPSPSTNHTVNTAAIAGGSSAAAVVVIAIALFFCILRRRRRQTGRQQKMTHPFTYSPPNTGMSEQFPIMRSVEPNTPPSQHQTFFGPGPRHQNSNLSMTATGPPSSHTFPAEVYSASDALRAPPALQPLRPQYSQEPQEIPPSRMNSAQATDGSDSSTIVAPLSGHGINALAKEVAAVLMQTPAFVYQGKDSRTAQNTVLLS